MNQLQHVIETLSSLIWGPPMLILLGGTGIYLTFRLGFIQFHKLFHALKVTFSAPEKHDNSTGDINHFQALTTALAAAIGTGNLIGVATAVSIGGPGAIFWMWLCALFGMCTKYSESLLAIKYRVRDEKGEMSGGPMYYLERGLNLKWLGILFAVFGSVAAFGIGNLVQANAVASSMKELAGINPLVTGIALSVLTAMVVLGGIKNIGKITGWLVPIMASLYISGCLVILVRNFGQIPEAFYLIIQGAFNGTSAAGGFTGAVVMTAIRMGVSRGVFSNEAGLGSEPIAAASAKTTQPARQAFVSMTGVFIDTILICTLTGLVIVITGAWQTGVDAALMTKTAFDIGLPGNSGGILISFSILFFAYSTILGWSYYGEKCIEYLVGIRAVLPYRLTWVAIVAVGAVVKLELVWSIADITNGLMAIPNLIGLLGLSGVVAHETRKYLDNMDSIPTGYRKKPLHQDPEPT